MKLSNKILIGLFGAILLYMLVAFTEVRLRGHKNYLESSETKIESKEIAGVSHVILPEIDRRINFSISNKPRVEIRSLSGAVLDGFDYELNGDTLEIKSLKYEKNDYVNVFVYVSESTLSSVDVNGASVLMTNLDLDSLTINISGGTVRFEEANRINRLKISGKSEAFVQGFEASIDTLIVDLDQSELKLWSGVKKLEGNMSNDSYLFVEGVQEIQFSKDRESRLELRN